MSRSGLFWAPLVWVVSRMPIPVANVLAWMLAWTWWTVLPVRRRLATENVRRAFPASADAEVRRTLVAMMHNLALTYMELLIFERRGVRLRVDGAELIPPGSLLIGGHCGAWDIALLALADDVPMAIFLRTPKDPWVARFLAGVRDRHGVLSLESGSGMADGYAALESGRSLMFIQDHRFNSGIQSPFFGIPCRTSTALAAAYLRTGRPIYACWSARVGPGRHRCWARKMEVPALTGDRATDVQTITDACNAYYTASITEHPSGWLWLHDRWK